MENPTELDLELAQKIAKVYDLPVEFILADEETFWRAWHRAVARTEAREHTFDVPA